MTATGLHHHHAGRGWTVRRFHVLQTGIKLHQDKDHVRGVEDEVPGWVRDDVSLAGDSGTGIRLLLMMMLLLHPTSSRHGLGARLLLVLLHSSTRITESINPDAEHAVLAQGSDEKVTIFPSLLKYDGEDIRAAYVHTRVPTDDKEGDQVCQDYLFASPLSSSSCRCTGEGFRCMDPVKHVFCR